MPGEDAAQDGVVRVEGRHRHDAADADVIEGLQALGFGLERREVVAALCRLADDVDLHEGVDGAAERRAERVDGLGQR